MNMYIK